MAKAKSGPHDTMLSYMYTGETVSEAKPIQEAQMIRTWIAALNWIECNYLNNYIIKENFTAVKKNVLNNDKFSNI